jgi:hypothetical protein
VTLECQVVSATENREGLLVAVWVKRLVTVALATRLADEAQRRMVMEISLSLGQLLSPAVEDYQLKRF